LLAPRRESGKRRALLARLHRATMSAESRAVATVEVYTTTYCPYCVRAKNLLRNKGVAFAEIDVTDDDALREKMVEMAGGRRTVPEIFINGKIVGGYDELKALDDAGQLDALLTEPAPA
jgi:glutaredoxin 3